MAMIIFLRTVLSEKIPEIRTFSTANIPKVVGGIDEQSLTACE